jgi:hypothetical protein
MIVINGWNAGAHPLFVDQLIKLVEAVEQKKGKKPRRVPRWAEC